MSDCFVLYLLLTCMKKKTSGADKFTNNNQEGAFSSCISVFLMNNLTEFLHQKYNTHHIFPAGY